MVSASVNGLTVGEKNGGSIYLADSSILPSIHLPTVRHQTVLTFSCQYFPVMRIILWLLNMTLTRKKQQSRMTLRIVGGRFLVLLRLIFFLQITAKLCIYEKAIHKRAIARFTYMYKRINRMPTKSLVQKENLGQRK